MDYSKLGVKYIKTPDIEFDLPLLEEDLETPDISSLKYLAAEASSPTALLTLEEPLAPVQAPVQTPTIRRPVVLSPSIPLSDFKRLFEHYITSWEGGRMATVAGDRGGPTNNGITIGTWKAYGSDKNGDGKIDEKDLAMMSKNDHRDILFNRFWNAAKADLITNPYVAAYVVDWMWGSGPGAFRSMHKAFGLKPQARMTNELLDAINKNPLEAYYILNNRRKSFYRSIVEKDPSQAKFLRGWLRRADAITLNLLKYA